MELFYGGGGRSNPDFIHKVRVKRSQNIDEMMKWCDDYPVQGAGHFQRYYIDWRNGDNKLSIWDTDVVTFQFEWEEPAIVFALKFGSA